MSTPENGFSNILALMQLVNMVKQQRIQQADATIAGLPNQGAGMTIAQSGLTPKQIKAKYGRDRNPSELVAADTPEAQQNRMIEARIASFTPEETDAFTSSLLNKAMGTPGAITRKGLASAAQAGETKAATEATTEQTRSAVANSTHQMVLKGLASLEKASPDIQAAQGLKVAGLQTAQETESDTLAAQIRTQTQKMALAALANPDHPLNKVMKSELGFNAITAAPAVALGMTTMLDKVADIAYAKAAGNKQLEVARFQAMLDEDKDMNRVEADWAKGIASNLGGTVTPRTVLNWKRWKESGGDAKSMPAGVTSNLDNTLTIATSVAAKAYVTDQAQKGDIYAQQILNLANMAKQIPNSNTLQAVGKLMQDYYGKIQVQAKLGPRPNQPGPAQNQWDAAAKYTSSQLPTFDANWFLTGGGVDLVTPKNGVPQQPMGKAPPIPSPTAPTANFNGQQVPLPPDASPDDMAAVQQFLQVLGMNMGQPPIKVAPSVQVPLKP